jgi:ribbon-helix-helix CopG family protein
VRVSLNLTPSTTKAVTLLAERRDMQMSEVIREALSCYWWLARERSAGTRFQIARDGKLTEMAVPSLNRLADGPPLVDPPE